MKVFLNWRILCAALLLVLSGCVTDQNRARTGVKESHARSTLSSGLRQIELYYYRETKASELVAVGLARVQENYPEVHFITQADETTAFLDDRPLYRFDNGEDAGNPHYWGQVVTASLVEIADADPAIDLEALMDSFMEGMLESLHERTDYRPINRTLEDRNSRGQGDGGFDLVLEPHRAGWAVKRIRNIPIRNSGTLREGDIIVEIDARPVDRSSWKVVGNLLRGSVGSSVTLRLLRQQNEQPISLTLDRPLRGSGSVALYSEGRSKRIELSHFSDRTSDDLEIAVSKLLSEGEIARNGLILDLRNNEGGLLSTSTEVAQLFLERKPIAEVHGRHPESHQYFSAGTSDRSAGAPMVVLVSAKTASGAEIVTSALQDAGRAIVIGEVTYGSGTIQLSEIFSAHALGMLPWGEVTTPAGYRLDKRGVMPTVCTGGEVTAEAVLSPLRSGGGIIDYATRTRDIDPDDAAAVEAFRALCPPRSDGADIDLEVARAILEEPALYAEILARDRQSKQAAAQ